MTDTLTTVFAALGTTTNMLFNVPQLVRVYKTQNVTGLSKKTILLRIICSAFWAAYSALLREWLFFSTCVVNILSETLLLVAKIRFTEKKDSKVIVVKVEL